MGCIIRLLPNFEAKQLHKIRFVKVMSRTDFSIYRADLCRCLGLGLSSLNVSHSSFLAAQF
jgi:hypothetical protein